MYNLISITGVSVFLYPYYYYNSKRSFMIFLNGIAYHGTGNAMLKYNDIVWNSLFILYTSYYYKTSRKYALAGSIIFLLNNYLYNNNSINKNNASVIHIRHSMDFVNRITKIIKKRKN